MVDEQVPFRTVKNEDGSAILDLHSGIITTLNPTGAYIWQALQDGDSTETIASNLARDTGESTTVIEHGVTAFLVELKRHNLWPR
jgi:hypothetical protein